jgi:hypothetical protein
MTFGEEVETSMSLILTEPLGGLESRSLPPLTVNSVIASLSSWLSRLGSVFPALS